MRTFGALWVGGLSLGALGVLGFAGCGSNGDDATIPSGTGTDAGGAEVLVVEDDAQTFPDGGPTGPTCLSRCSSDLHQLLDCDGKVLKTCPAEQGCAAGGCAVPCESARANKSTVGCEFFSTQPDAVPQSARCYAVFVTNTWTTPVTIQVDNDKGLPARLDDFARIPQGMGETLSYRRLKDGQLPPGQVAILFLSGKDCPDGVTPPFSGPNVSGTAIGKAYHFTTDAPVVAYDIFPYGGGNTAVTSATLLLPTSAWDTNYVAVLPYAPSKIPASLPPTVQLVAAEDGTEVTISPTVAIAGGGAVQGTAAGKPRTYALGRGQVLQFAQTDELTGSPIQSNKPIGMWGTASSLNVEVDQSYSDSAHQQVPPVRALGSEYVGVRYRNRTPGGPEEAPPWRVMGLVDGTKLTWEPSAPAGAPTELRAGQLVKFNATGPFVVRSQDETHPIYVAAHMTGCTAIGGALGKPPYGCMGDAEWVNVVPARQFMSSYVFFTDPTYPETNLVVVRSKAKDGAFKDVELDCAGKLTGWQPAGAGTAYEYTRVDLVRGNFEKQGRCDNGRREMKSDAPFGVTVWGWGSLATEGDGTSFFSQAVSYAYPAGQSVLPINSVLVPPAPR